MDYLIICSQSFFLSFVFGTVVRQRARDCTTPLLPYLCIGRSLFKKWWDPFPRVERGGWHMPVNKDLYLSMAAKVPWIG